MNGHLVEEGVGATEERLLDVEGAEAGVVPVEEALPCRRTRNVVAAVGRPQLGGRGHPLLQSGGPCHQLKGRPGRVDVGDGVVAERLVGIPQVRIERRGADAGREGVEKPLHRFGQAVHSRDRKAQEDGCSGDRSQADGGALVHSCSSVLVRIKDAIRSV